ncbi:hypothetical protein TNCV_2228011 [Trichonephila clavipes]|nr:hypothetical protein TNCV_2228011 [Trichonephila clavipes]
MVPKMSSPEQKEMRANMARDLIDMTDEDGSFLKISRQVMRHGAFLTTLGQNVSQLNGKQKHHQGRRYSTRTKAEGKC